MKIAGTEMPPLHELLFTMVIVGFLALSCYAGAR